MLKGKYHVVEGKGGCDKVIIIAKSSYDIEVRREQNRYIVYSVQYEN